MRLLALLLTLATTSFESAIDRAFTEIQNNDWAAAAASLDQAYADQPEMFTANNLHYLRGRVAENQGDWQRARNEFRQIGSGNPLYALASWHAATASAKLREDSAAMEFLAALPRNFPAELKAQLAREAGGPVALQLYQDLPTREARFQRARSLNDTTTMWALIR